MIRGRDHAQRRVDRVDRARIQLRVVKARGIAQDRHGLGDAAGNGARIAERSKQRRIRQLIRVAERRAAIQLMQPLLDALRQRRQRLRAQQTIERLDVGVDRQHVDAVGAEKSGQRRHRQIGRRRIAGRRVNQGHAHVARKTTREPLQHRGPPSRKHLRVLASCQPRLALRQPDPSPRDRGARRQTRRAGSLRRVENGRSDRNSPHSFVLSTAAIDVTAVN